MRSRLPLLASFALLVALPSRALAGDLAVMVRDGLVTIQARDASVRQILTEWARQGQVRIVHPERLPATPISIELSGVPEALALDVLLRGVSGYVLAPRDLEAAGPSVFDQLVVMAPSVPPPVAAAPRPTFQTPTPIAPPQMPQPTGSDGAVDDSAPAGQGDGVQPAVPPTLVPPTFRGPVQAPSTTPPPVPIPNPNQQPPFRPFQTPQNAVPTQVQPASPPPSTVGAPSPGILPVQRPPSGS
jgi:hypothetical protein